MSDQQTVHATCVAWDGQGVLITGRAGQGKSALALQLMALGFMLVADDRVRLERRDDAVIASCPASIAGLIEARGIGILNAAHAAQATLLLVVDLDETEHERLPKRGKVTLLGCEIALIRAIHGPHFAAAILQIVKAGWSDR